MARSRILLAVCVLCVALPGLASAQQPDVDPVQVSTVADKLGAKVLPSSERQMRPLLALRKVNESPTVWQPKLVQVWEKALDYAEVTKKRLTEKPELERS